MVTGIGVAGGGTGISASTGSCVTTAATTGVGRGSSSVPASAEVPGRTAGCGSGGAAIELLSNESGNCAVTGCGGGTLTTRGPGGGIFDRSGALDVERASDVTAAGVGVGVGTTAAGLVVDARGLGVRGLVDGPGGGIALRSGADDAAALVVETSLVAATGGAAVGDGVAVFVTDGGTADVDVTTPPSATGVVELGATVGTVAAGVATAPGLLDIAPVLSTEIVAPTLRGAMGVVTAPGGGIEARSGPVFPG